MYQYSKGFLKARGLAIREEDGDGRVILLQGLNLGSLFLIEKWMTGIGEADKPAIEDEWTMRDVLAKRFGDANCKKILGTYYDSYAKPFDFDTLLDMGINMVRLPIYYRLLQDDKGNWITDPNGEIDFSEIDRVVNACADRGIYVLLDLHGAPGCQNKEAHSGRQNFNKLFLNTPEGETYRRRTVELWNKIAAHYKDESAVCGYDLLNEPVGAPKKEDLWQLYGRIYKAIRSVDSNHIIVMEGIWDWDTLPRPRDKGWQNVVYQFHYYLWDHNEDVDAHKAFINQKIALSRVKQKEYRVPVMIGEFTCFSLKAIWEYYLTNFNREKWSWTMWSYKSHFSPSEWGLYNHSEYNGEPPKLRSDSFSKLTRKLSKYATQDYHFLNFSLSEILKDYLFQPVSGPYINRIAPESVRVGWDFTIKGFKFGNTQGSSRVIFEGNAFPVISWSDTLIHVYVPDSERRRCGMLTVQKNGVSSNEVVLHVIQPPQVDKVVPSSAVRGTEITILGGSFGNFAGEIQFYPAGTTGGLAKITYWSNTKIKCIVPKDAISGPVTIRTPYGNAVFRFTVGN
jgi:aryl-phospho-beta-D-glucosidase BglC (GH1 family)